MSRRRVEYIARLSNGSILILRLWRDPWVGCRAMARAATEARARGCYVVDLVPARRG